MKKPIDIIIAPSLERADWLNFERDILELEAAGADLLHIDIMDKTYGENILISPVLIPQIKKITKMPLDIHMYVSDPESYFPVIFDSCGDDYINLEVEAVKDISRLLQIIKENGCKPAISVEIGTSLHEIEPLLEQVDLVNIMVRNSGFSNKPISEYIFNKIENLKSMIVKKGLDILIEVDGSIDFEDTAMLLKRGADVFVYGTKVIFREKHSFKESIDELKTYLNENL